MLKELGFTEKETAVYLVCLKLGQSGINRIAELANLPKSTAYDTLNSLANKGLIAVVIRDKVRYFEAANPKHLLTSLKQKEKKVAAILPQLSRLWDSVGARPRTEMYQGKEGIKTIYDEILKQKQEFLVMGYHEGFRVYYAWFADQFVKQRVKAGIKCRYLTNDSKWSRQVRKEDKTSLRKTRFSPLMNKQGADCYIFGNNVVFISFSDKEPVGILIENADIAKLQKTLFEQIWKS